MHYFDVNIAATYGVNCAVVLQNIFHWVRKNEANGKHFHDGSYWTYNSTKAFAELFPYLTQKQVETALKKLRDDGILKTGNYNDFKYDRTLWYAITKKGECILLGKEMDAPDDGNGNPAEGEPIPNKNTDVKPSSINTDVNSIVDYLNEKAGKSFRAKSKGTAKHINARLAEGFSVDDFKTVIDKKCAEWLGTEFEQYLRPETLFGTKFEGYLNAPVRAKAQARTYGANGIAIEDKPSELDGIL